jgi:hypothetical protein
MYRRFLPRAGHWRWRSFSRRRRSASSSIEPRALRQSAARGFGDPAAYALFVAGFVLPLGRPDRAARSLRLRRRPVFALALFARPNIAPAMASRFGAGSRRSGSTSSGARRMCLGFLPVLGMALHNWVYAVRAVHPTATHHGTLVTLPSVYLAALSEPCASIIGRAGRPRRETDGTCSPGRRNRCGPRR